MNRSTLFQQLKLILWILVLILSINGCVGPQIKGTTQAAIFNLTAQKLQNGELAFITPSSVTGQEEDKQAMAMVFVQAVQTARPNLKVIPLAKVLSAINASGLADDYKRMLEDYHVTGIFEHKILKKIAEVAQARYIAQLKLSGFRQESKNRFSVLGLRLADTKSTDIRVFLQIWDSHNGSVVWEGTHELTSARDTLNEETVTFRSAMEEAARQLTGKLP